MILRNTAHSWGAVSKTLHWLIVLLIITQWVIMQRAETATLISDKLLAIGMHKSFGMTIFALAIVRLVWRWLNPVPTLEGKARRWEQLLARVSHVLLYGLILSLPLSGWLMSSARGFPVSWFDRFTLPDLVARSEPLYRQMQDLHHPLFSVLVCVALLHIAGALKHHIIDRNDVLRRMLPFGGALIVALISSALPVSGHAAEAAGGTRYVQAAEGNSLTFTFTQLGAANTGRFKTFATELVYDPANPAQGSLIVRVTVDSLDTQDAERDGVLKTPELFDTAKHPAATFFARTFARDPSGGLVAVGKLTIRGRSRDLRLPLQLKSQGGGLELSGQVAMRRLDFGVGQGEWQSTESVGDEVKLQYKVALVPAPAS